MLSVLTTKVKFCLAIDRTQFPIFMENIPEFSLVDRKRFTNTYTY